MDRPDLAHAEERITQDEPDQRVHAALTTTGPTVQITGTPGFGRFRIRHARR
ncbi:hypothetical protein [Kitasatospora phosalacinea]|uniref:Uncharacterized protein n=1 Tax=Kitasatospora phosalacinea TaxID=2065 RepID=A0A9W6PFY7_9ACTN|nr:hypothetical protein [Kitasatospora phosalacinea]GLW55314.1 hypothetical protein Kpho01_33250 [Kitasatospora phosalacinea]